MPLVLGYAMVKNTVYRRVWDQVVVTPGSIYTGTLSSASCGICPPSKQRKPQDAFYGKPSPRQGSRT